MRLVIQRVDSAQVRVKKESVGSINRGLFILVGVAKGDSKKDAENLAAKVSKLRIMADENDKMNLSVSDAKAQLLVVSQFTLYADTKKGNRPSFVKAAEPKLAEDIYEYFIMRLKSYSLKVETGKFGEYMKINSNLDGPVTIILES